MRALVRDVYGSPDVLRFAEVATPTPEEDQVLVRVHATSINDWDWAMIRGEATSRLLGGLLRPRKFPIVGGDVAGRVEAVGANVTTFRPGDEVYGDLCMAGFGCFAESVCAPARCLIAKPPGMTFEQAAAIPQAGMLAAQGLLDVGRIGRIESGPRTLLLNGAGGGVGTFAVQLARPYGLEITCVDSAGKLDMLSELGADQVIDYRREDFTRIGRTWDLILDTRTTRPPGAYLRALAPGGSYVTVGGDISRLIRIALARRWVGRHDGKRLQMVELAPNKDLAFYNERFEAGAISPVIDGPYAFDEAIDAFRRFARGEHLGKIVVTITP